MQLLRRIPGAEPDQDAIKMQVAAFKVNIDQLLPKLAEASKIKETTKKEDSSAAKLFEEVKIMFQDLPGRIESRAYHDGFPRRKRPRNLYPMLEEMSHIAFLGPDDPSGIILLVSLLRDDFPSLYELGMEAYRAAVAGKPGAAMKNIHSLRRLAEYMGHGPMADEFGYGSKETFLLLMELPNAIERATRNYLENRKPAR